MDSYHKDNRSTFSIPKGGLCWLTLNGRMEQVLKRHKVLVVGLDLREYSRRSPEEQLFLTISLGECINKAIAILRNCALMPPEEPRIFEHTGDGAFAVFTYLDTAFGGLAAMPAGRTTKHRRTVGRERHSKAWAKRREELENAGFLRVVDAAFSFVFALNALISNDNARQPFKYEDEGESNSGRMPAFPIECRFAVSYDDVIFRQPLTIPMAAGKEMEKLACSGAGIVTCSRILASDHGSHLLIQDKLLHKLEEKGGLGSICRGIWGQQLHGAMLDEKEIKSGTYRFADVFGFYHDGPLLSALGRAYEQPRQIHIGSHNVTSISTKAESGK